MALQVWLPLDGTLENKGLTNTTVTNIDATITSPGKIGGSCYNFAGSGQRIKFNNPITNGMNSFSICTWFYMTTISKAMWGARSNGGGPGLLCFLYDNRLLFDDGSRYTCYYDFNSLLNSWHHIACVKTPTQKIVYIDGVAIGSQDTTTTTSGIRNELTIGNDSYEVYNGNDFQGKLNDFRVYDNALSAKEIKEISKALILHYKLDDNGFQGMQILKGTAKYLATGNGQASNSTWSLMSGGNGSGSVEVDNTAPIGGKVWRISNNTSGNKDWCQEWQPLPFILGETYTLSAWIKGQANLLWRVWERSPNSAQRWAWNKSINHPNDWQYYSASFVATQEMVSNNCAIQIGCGGSSNGNLDMCGQKLERGSIATPWSPAIDEFIDGYQYPAYQNLIYDSSGYENNGYVKNGPYDVTSITPRYLVATHIISGQTIMSDKSSSAILPRYEITYSIWFNSANPGARFFSCTEGGGFNIETSGNYLKPIIYIAGTGYVNVIGVTPYANLANAWHMATVTYSAGIMSFYIDGVLEKSGNVANNLIQYPSSTPLTLGGEAQGLNNPADSGYVGDLSDCRIYATALSAADVKELYETSMVVDSNGNILPRVLI